MVLRLDSKENGFKVAFEGLRKNTTDNDALSKQVAKIISEIKDSRLIDFANKYNAEVIERGSDLLELATSRISGTFSY